MGRKKYLPPSGLGESVFGHPAELKVLDRKVDDDVRVGPTDERIGHGGQVDPGAARWENEG